jgi:hypothetical protein
MWTLTDMTKKLNWEKRRFDFRPKTNIKDENEFRKGDMAARWLERAEQRQADQRKHQHQHKRKHKHKHKHKHKQPRPAEPGPVQPVTRPRPAGPNERPHAEGGLVIPMSFPRWPRALREIGLTKKQIRRHLHGKHIGPPPETRGPTSEKSRPSCEDQRAALMERRREREDYEFRGIDRSNPYAQRPGVDMSTPPWE